MIEVTFNGNVYLVNDNKYGLSLDIIKNEVKVSSFSELLSLDCLHTPLIEPSSKRTEMYFQFIRLSYSDDCAVVFAFKKNRSISYKSCNYWNKFYDVSEITGESGLFVQSDIIGFFNTLFDLGIVKFI